MQTVKRLCCGDVGWRDGEAHQCTLAIGDHDEHEDIATGTRWGKATRSDEPLTLAEAERLYASTCIVVRRRREAPLVALVNACPAGLDPVGWRAAVLALNERRIDDISGAAEQFTRFMRGECAGRVTDVLDAWSAYQRALQPTPRPAPFRRRAPGLPCDDGRDDE